jgi:ribosome silencing factor RsfS/YbeB/iojap
MDKVNARVEAIVELLDSKKGEDIQTFDLSAKDYIADSVIIVNSLGNKHTVALLEYLREFLKQNNEKILNIDESEDWAICDLGDIIIHIMTAEYREKYNLEEFLQTIYQNTPQ